LGKAGLLENLLATTHHMNVERLREVAPNTLIKKDVRIVDNNHIIVAAGVFAGIDLSLYVVSKLLGKEWAVKTARVMEYDFVA
jgi:transcriptional regulator GlxA family with amidase domain